jgi:hypothetical protein
MKARNFKLVVMFLAFVLSIGLGWAADSRAKAWWSGGSLVHAKVAWSNQAPKKRTFKLVEHSCESGCDDDYESSDGQRVSLTGACYTSTAKDTRREVRRMISEGRIVKKGKRYYRYDRQRRLGTRTVVIYPPDETGGKPAKIFWYVGGTCFSYISAGSLELALEFERSDEFAKANE